MLGGLDLSSVNDLTAFALVFGDAEGGFDVLIRFWLPEDNIVDLEREHDAPYRLWAERGFITLTPGNVVDYGFVRREVRELAARYDLKRLLADKYNALKTAIELKEEDGLPVEFLTQGFLSLSPATKQLERLVLAGTLRHGGHPILRWNASNAVAVRDEAGNIKLSKKRSTRKIDGLAATVNAIAAATSGDDVAGASVYETRGLVVL